MKRILDVFVSSCLLLLATPLLLLIAILIYLRMGSPVLFRQTRPGLYGAPFTIYKFRTMTSERDVEGRLLPDDVRLTALGGIMRRLSLDELPQLFNVLKGELSLVGPRPLLMSYLSLYTKEQARRHEVKPGITGWAQIHGRNLLSWEEKFALDIWYVDHRSFWLDLKIIAITIGKVLRKEGIAMEGHVTMPEFTGMDAGRKRI